MTEEKLKEASIILNYYIEALESLQYDDNEILDDLENDVIRITKEINNWSNWKYVIESWTKELKNQNNNQ